MLSRRLAVKAALAGLVAAPIAAAPLLTVAHAAGLPADYPSAGCFTATDPKGDAIFEKTPDNPDLDVLGFAVETTSTSLRAYANVDKLSASGPTYSDGHRFTLKFTFNSHVFSASGSDYGHGSGAIRDGLAQTGQAAHTTQLGIDTPAVDPTNPAFVTSKGFVDSGLKITFDYTHSWVVWDLPIADIEKYGQAKFTGDITTLGVQAQTDEYAVGSIWDSAPDLGDDGNLPGTWTVGDNKCFGGSGAASGASTVLGYVGDTHMQYGDTARVAASVVDASGKPVAGAPVTFAIGKLQTTAKTNAKGLAQTTLSPTVTAGHYTLVTTTASDGGKTSVRTPFVVSVERTVLRLSKSGGKIFAALTDDDKQALAGQRIVWTVNGKGAGTTKTDASGHAVLTHAAKGAAVKAAFKPAKGKYAGSTATTTA
jgi:hypothetical protein